MVESDINTTKVVISKGNTSRECITNGIDKLGGISDFINKEDQIFIKFNLSLANGFPSITNLDTLYAIIQACVNVGANKIYAGSFPTFKTTVKTISDSLGLKDSLQKIGAEFVFLDSSDYYAQKSFNTRDLKILKNRAFSKVKLNNCDYDIPKVILNSDKFISLNQVNVDPLFDCRTSLINHLSMISYKNQEKILKNSLAHNFEESKKNLASHILNLFTIKKPNLVINDLFYILEGAGPFLCKDSNLKKTNLMVIGNDAVAVDTITLEMLNFNLWDNIILKEVSKRNIGFSNPSNITILGEPLNSCKLNIDKCVSKLDDLKITNLIIKSGRVNLTDFKQAYYFLNFIKQNLVKDLKYISINNFLIGENPPEPEVSDNIIIFGDDAIKSTENYRFRRIEKKYDKKTKSIVNKNIIELPGNPPNIIDCINLMLKHFGKKNLPVLNLLVNLKSSELEFKTINQLESWEAL